MNCFMFLHITPSICTESIYNENKIWHHSNCNHLPQWLYYNQFFVIMMFKPSHILIVDIYSLVMQLTTPKPLKLFIQEFECWVWENMTQFHSIPKLVTPRNFIHTLYVHTNHIHSQCLCWHPVGRCQSISDKVLRFALFSKHNLRFGLLWACWAV